MGVLEDDCLAAFFELFFDLSKVVGAIGLVLNKYWCRVDDTLHPLESMQLEVGVLSPNDSGSILFFIVDTGEECTETIRDEHQSVFHPEEVSDFSFELGCRDVSLAFDREKMICHVICHVHHLLGWDGTHVAPHFDVPVVRPWLLKVVVIVSLKETAFIVKVFGSQLGKSTDQH